MKNELKISFFEEIHHVTSNENEFKIVNNLFVNNDSNSNNNNNFILIISFTYFAFLITIFNMTVC